MAFVQAHKRNKPYTHTFPHVTLVFEPNDKGDVVCDVADADTVERLLLTPTGFRLYGEQPEAPVAAILTAKVEQVPLAPEKDKEKTPDVNLYVLKDEESGTEFDLRPLDDAALHAFAKANDIKVHHAAKGDTIRDKIVAFFKTEG